MDKSTKIQGATDGNRSFTARMQLSAIKKRTNWYNRLWMRFLEDTDLGLMDFSSTIGRNCARAIESSYICEYIFKLVSRLLQNVKYYNTDTWTNYHFWVYLTRAMDVFFLGSTTGSVVAFCQYLRIKKSKTFQSLPLPRGMQVLKILMVKEVLMKRHSLV